MGTGYFSELHEPSGDASAGFLVRGANSSPLRVGKAACPHFFLRSLGKAAWPLLLLAACIGPQIVVSEEVGGKKTGSVWFAGKEGHGYVTAQVMAERAAEAEALARTFCDGGIQVVERRAEGRDNHVDFTCGGPPPDPCVEKAVKPAPKP
jgi:hypothetical protein